ncbi:hypothetical protein acsn021_02630 [Anaerocolumna cellulosilytica]|uniref:Uncharacterized protein n=1 Tax=Anaerocolumna cellulosilytica TaxID=433286 RepID=A0A6S6QQ38_9FIRM|nr:pentapeptide repeat-containing protein [Anaerocolumna cellulosilytica]MBB5196904.1 D-ribose pyranose/furanose isomerase RbsD [Anaerocolumna cellulosilytica]BCJ92694.1 hypothetical protein acsn021_02630 [Anaerocolumna cellulosilytica]
MKHELEKFYINEVETRLSNIRKEIEQELDEKSAEWKEQFLLEFKVLCKRIDQYCVEKSYEPFYLIFHLLRTRILEHNYQYEVKIYNEDWYLEDGIYVGDFNVAFIYHQFEKLWKQLMCERLRYVRKISEADIQFIILETVGEFHQYILRFLRENIIEAISTEEYKSLTKGNRFVIKTGEYLEIGDFIFVEENNKDYVKLVQWLDEHKEGDVYTFEDFSGIVIKDKQYTNMDLRYVNFSGARFENVTFHNCKLEGARFDLCDLATVGFD